MRVRLYLRVCVCVCVSRSCVCGPAKWYKKGLTESFFRRVRRREFLEGAANRGLPSHDIYCHSETTLLLLLLLHTRCCDFLWKLYDARLLSRNVYFSLPLSLSLLLSIFLLIFRLYAPRYGPVYTAGEMHVIKAIRQMNCDVCASGKKYSWKWRRRAR